MPNNESYHKYPIEDVEEVLKACLWERSVGNQWEKGRSRILVDQTGIFLFRLQGHQWVRTYGMAHNRVERHLPDLRILFDDGFSLNLLTGE